MRSLRPLVPLVLLAACGGVGVGGSVDVENVPEMRFEEGLAYSAKFLCGTISAVEDSPQFPDASRDTAAVLVPGTYLTTVNIVNPGTETAQLVKHVVVTRAEMAGRAGRSETVRDSLIADQGFYVDCGEILRLVDKRITLRDGFLEGFVVIHTRTPLQVTGVYTFKNVEIRAR